jgi:hypothetical protein
MRIASIIFSRLFHAARAPALPERADKVLDAQAFKTLAR